MAAAGRFAPGELQISVLQGRNMPNKDIHKMDPYVKITVGPSKGGGISKKTKVIEKGGTDVTWDEILTFQLDGSQDTVTLYAADDDNLVDDKIGDTTIPLLQLIAQGANVQWYPLQHCKAPAGEIALSCTYRCYIVGALTVTLHTGSQLKDQDIFLKMDPYVTMQLDTEARAKRSKTHNGAGSSPNFDEEQFVFQLRGAEHYLITQVWDEDLGRDDLVGGHRLDLRQLRLEQNPNHPEMLLHIGSGRNYEKPAGTLKISLNFTPAV
jgi:Ca2+-dependent lipid-binding protein